MPPPEERTSEAAAVAAIVRAAQTPTHFTERKGVVVFPNGTTKSLENELLDAHPKRRRARVDLYEAESFIDYVKRYKIADRTIIFGRADETGGSFTSVLDYHQSTDVAGDAADRPSGAGWGEHICTFTLATTPEWKRWLGNNNKPIEQEAFAEFIEDNAPDIVLPDAATLLDMALFLQAKKSVTFKSGRSLRNGSVQLEYTETIEETSGRRDDSTQLPEKIVVRMTPFVGMPGVDIPARLRFRISNGGKLSFQYVLDRPFKVIEAAFTNVAARIETETQIPVMLGNGHVTAPPSIP